jgi:hypothetical protein
MPDFSFRLILFIYSLITLGIYLAMGSLAIIFDMHTVNGVAVSSSILNEVARSWAVMPYVDAIVINKETGSQFENKCPDQYPEYVMERMFYGA